MKPSIIPTRHVPRCEALETRDTPAGNVTALVSVGWAGGFHLSVTGDGDPAGNQVQVFQDEFGSVYVYGLNGTTVNGREWDLVCQGDPTRVDIHLSGDGADAVEVGNLTAGAVAVFTGGGDDFVNMHDILVRSLVVDAGDGNDTFALQSVSAAKGGYVSGGAGYDVVYFGHLSGPVAYLDVEESIPVG